MANRNMANYDLLKYSSNVIISMQGGKSNVLF